jgi:four helix bundle protein
MTANYRAARRARSHAEFTARIGVTVEEADEAVFWLRLTMDSQLLTGPEVQELRTEAQALSAICAATYRTARATDPRRGR